MFDLTQHKANLGDIKFWSENEGDEKIPACDLMVQIRIGNDFLSEFHPDLKASIYRAPNPGEGDLLNDGTATKLRMEKLGMIRWDQEFTGYTLTIHNGFSGMNDIILPYCAISKFKFDCEEGGTVIASFRVKARDESQDQFKALCLMADQVADITLTPPEL
jgi:hypothetical protein